LDTRPGDHQPDLGDPLPDLLVSFGFVFMQTFRGKVGWKLALPFAINLVANVLFMPIFAGLRNVPVACVDILIVWATIIWCVMVAWPVYNGLPSPRCRTSCGCPPPR
jgi:TspO/MBR family